jgi:hypothetical protein
MGRQRGRQTGGCRGEKHGRREETEEEDDGNRGWTGAKRKVRCEANKTKGAVAVGGEEGEELKEEWLKWWYSSREPKKWQLKGCKRERSKWCQRLEIETNAPHPGSWVYAVGKGREGGMVEE